MIDLMAIAAVDRETEVTYIRRERDWVDRALADGRLVGTGRLLPMLPASIAAGRRPTAGNGHGHGTATATAGDGGAGAGHATRSSGSRAAEGAARAGRQESGEESRGDTGRVPFLGLGWDDVLFVVLAAVMIGVGPARRARCATSSAAASR